MWKKASSLSAEATDPRLRVIWQGLNHQHESMQGALQLAAAVEIQRAGRFLPVMDTIITLAPLLGLLGTVTGAVVEVAITQPIHPLLDANTRSFVRANWKGTPNTTETRPVDYVLR